MTVLGVIAEGKSDVEVVGVLAGKIAGRSIPIRSAVGRGCGRLQKHALPWARELHRRGCTRLMLVCDLDQNDLPELTARLSKALEAAPIARRVVVIPVREIEAWLLADHEAVNRAFTGRRALKQQANPESLVDPKSRLGEWVSQRSERRVEYVSTVHNAQIARHAQVAQLRRCTSFRGFEAFVREHIG